MTRRITVFTVLTLLWCAMIFFLSSQPADESSQTSGVFADFIKTVFFPDFDKLSEARQQDILDSITFIVRKGAHFTAYGILGALAFQTLCFIKRKLVRGSRGLCLLLRLHRRVPSDLCRRAQRRAPRCAGGYERGAAVRPAIAAGGKSN